MPNNKKDFSDRFFQDAALTDVDGSDSLHRSYPHFVGYFDDREELTERDVVIGAYFTYGWMPRMLDLRGTLGATIKLLNGLKTEGCRLTTDEIETIASNVNGSVVGTSKLLHFIRPDVHAIWDSRVYRYLYQKEPYSYRLEAANVYNGYLDLLAYLREDNRFGDLKVQLEDQIGYQVSDNRIGEYVMYYHGAKQSAN